MESSSTSTTQAAVRERASSSEPDLTWRSPELGEPREVRLAQGTVRYHERGTGPTIVLAHGWLINANLWRKVVPLLAATHRCITPDLPFGSHHVPVDEATDLSPPGCGRLIADFLAALELTDVTLVGNDSGGAYSQIATAAAPERIARLVLNACETPYDPFPPLAFTALKEAAREEATLRQLLSPLADPTLRSAKAAYARLAKRPLPDPILASYALPVLRDPRILHDARRVMSSADGSYISAAGEQLCRSYTRPVLLVWSPEDHFFPLDHAQRYARELPQGRVELIADSFSLAPEDQPQQLAALLRAG